MLAAVQLAPSAFPDEALKLADHELVSPTSNILRRHFQFADKQGSDDLVAVEVSSFDVAVLVMRREA